MRRDLPPELCRAIDAAVQPDPDARLSAGTLRRALAGAIDDVDDEPGTVAGPRDSRGLTATRQALLEATRHHARRRAARPAVRSAPHDRGRRRVHGRAARRADATFQDGALGLPRLGLAARLAAGAGAAALAGAALAALGPQPPVAVSAGACAAGLAVALLPRAGWLLTMLMLASWLAVEQPGVALLVLFAAGPVPLLLARQRQAWSAPAFAPLLSVAGLAGAWPVLAGQAARWQTRAALGALGGWWLALTETLTSDPLLSGVPREVLVRDEWEGSALDAIGDALWPLLSGGALGLAALFAAAAATLPLLVRGRSATIDLVGAAAWAATLAAATGVLARALELSPPRGLVVAAIVAGLAAVAARAVRGRA